MTLPLLRGEALAWPPGTGSSGDNDTPLVFSCAFQLTSHIPVYCLTGPHHNSVGGHRIHGEDKATGPQGLAQGCLAALSAGPAAWACPPVTCCQSPCHFCQSPVPTTGYSHAPTRAHGQGR